MTLTKSTALEINLKNSYGDGMKAIKKYYLFVVGIVSLVLFFSCETTGGNEPAPSVSNEPETVQIPGAGIPEVEPVVPEGEAQPSSEPEPAVEPKTEPGEAVFETEPEPVIVIEPEPGPEPEQFTVTSFVEDLHEVLATGSLEDSLQFFENVPEEYADNFSINYLQAALNVSSGNYAQAAEITEKLAEAQPENTDILMLQAVIEKANGNTKKKQEILKKVIAIEPYNTDANTELGDEQMLKKNFKTANTYYLKALAGDGNNIDALAGYGQSAYYLNNIKDAEKTFKKMLELDPENAFAWSYLSKLRLEDMDYKGALGYIEKAVQYSPGYYDYWVDYGTCLKNLGKTEEADAAWTKAIELKPNYFLSYVYRGGLYDEEERLEDAVADYLMAAKVNPNYYYAFEALGILYWGLGKWSDSRYWFQKIADIFPSNTSYQMIVAVTYFLEGQTKEGKNYVSKTCLKNLDKSSVEYTLMRLFYDNVAPGTAANKIQAETNLNKRGKLLFYLAAYYQSRGNDSIAQKYYISITELENPSFFEYRLAEWAVAKYQDM